MKSKKLLSCVMALSIIATSTLAFRTNVQAAESNKTTNTQETSILTNGPRVEDNTFQLYKDGGDVKAEFQLDKALDTINVEDFKISGIGADDSDFYDGKVTLTFSEGNKPDAVLALGSAAILQISPSSTCPSKDIDGRIIESGTQKVYHNKIAPETNRDNYSATVTIDGATNKVTDAHVYVTLKTPVDASILATYKDDFIFTNLTKGTVLYAESVKLDITGDKTTLVFTIKDAATKVASGNKIDITANPDKYDIDLRSQIDESRQYTLFVPTSYDLIAKTVKVTEVHASAGTTQN